MAAQSSTWDEDPQGVSLLLATGRVRHDLLVIAEPALLTELDEAWGRPASRVRLSFLPGVRAPGGVGQEDALVTYEKDGLGVLIARGRTSLFEGRSAARTTAFARIAAGARVRAALLATRASSLGALVPGDVLAVRDHLSLTGAPLFPAVRTVEAAWDTAFAERLTTVDGVTGAGIAALIPGPVLPTPAEALLLAELGGKTPMARADDYFDDHGYGLGPERSGVLLLIAPGSRDWWISTRGTSITTFTDAGIQALGTRLKEPLGKSDWNGAATLFVQQCDRYMKAARAGSPITHAPLTARQKTLHWLGAGGGVLLGGVGPGWMIVQLVFVRKMRNEGLEPDARSYVTPGSLTITSRQDRFVTKYVTRTKRESSSSSSSSSDSSTHTSSSDATHGGGGGSF